MYIYNMCIYIYNMYIIYIYNKYSNAELYIQHWNMHYDVGSQCIIPMVPLKLTIFTGLAYGTGLHLEMPRKYSSLAGECILYIYTIYTIYHIL